MTVTLAMSRALMLEKGADSESYLLTTRRGSKASIFSPEENIALLFDICRDNQEDGKASIKLFFEVKIISNNKNNIVLKNLSDLFTGVGKDGNKAERSPAKKYGQVVAKIDVQWEHRHA